MLFPSSRHVADWSCRNVVAIATHFNSSPEHSHRLRGPSVCLFRLVGEKLVWLERCEAPASRESGATQLEFLKWDQHGKHLAGVDSYGHIIIWGSQTPSDQWIFQHVFDVGESVAAVAWIHEDREWTLSRDASSDLGPALIRAQHKGPRLPTSGIGLVVLTVSGRVRLLARGLEMETIERTITLTPPSAVADESVIPAPTVYRADILLGKEQRLIVAASWSNEPHVLHIYDMVLNSPGPEWELVRTVAVNVASRQCEPVVRFGALRLISETTMVVVQQDNPDGSYAIISTVQFSYTQDCEWNVTSQFRTTASLAAANVHSYDTGSDTVSSIILGLCDGTVEMRNAATASQFALHICAKIKFPLVLHDSPEWNCSYAEDTPKELTHKLGTVIISPNGTHLLGLWVSPTELYADLHKMDVHLLENDQLQRTLASRFLLSLTNGRDFADLLPDATDILSTKASDLLRQLHTSFALSFEDVKDTGDRLDFPSWKSAFATSAWPLDLQMTFYRNTGNAQMYFNTCAMLLVQQALCSCYDMLELPGATKRMLEAEPVMAFFETNGRRHPVPLKEDSLGAAALMLLWLADFACASMTQMYAVFHIQKNGVADMVEDTSRNPSILALFFHAEFRRALFRIMMILGRFNESFRRFAMLAKQQQDYPRLSYLASVMQVAKKGSFFHMDKYARFLTALDSQVVQSIENSGCTEQQKRQFEQQLIVEGTLCHIYRSILPGLRDLFGSTVNDIFSATTHLHSDSSPLTGMILRGQKVLQEYSTPSAIGIRSWAHVTGTHQEILKNKHFGREFANFCGGHS